CIEINSLRCAVFQPGRFSRSEVVKLLKGATRAALSALQAALMVLQDMVSPFFGKNLIVDVWHRPHG
ncbi:hypothetical protein HHI36_013170, partial [Cryptolaemus montrouzieri]